MPVLSAARAGLRMDDARLVELLARSAVGQSDAFAELYDATAARVYGVIVEVVQSTGAASDIGQDVFADVWRHGRGYRPDRGPVLAWILTIAHRRAVDRVRAAVSTTSREVRYARSDPDPQPVDVVREQTCQRWETGRVRSALAQLSPAQRDAVTLAYCHGYFQTQVAAWLNIRVGTVKTKIRDGLTRLHHQPEVQP